MESGSSGMVGTILGGLLLGAGFTFGVTLSSDESCDVDGGSFVPWVNIPGEFSAGTNAMNVPYSVYGIYV